MSALPQALTGGGGGLPSLVSTLPSQLTRFLPGGLGSVRGLSESVKYQQEAVQAHMPKVLSSLLSARGISPADRSIQTLAPKLALTGAASQLQKSADSPATEPVLSDKLSGAYEFNVRSIDLDAGHILEDSQNQETDGEELDKIKEGLEIILAKEFDRHAVVNSSPYQVAKGEVHDTFNEENLANLKRNFEEILIREFRRYGGEIS
jgi:hypothetical protein